MGRDVERTTATPPIRRRGQPDHVGAGDGKRPGLLAIPDDPCHIQSAWKLVGALDAFNTLDSDLPREPFPSVRLPDVRVQCGETHIVTPDRPSETSALMNTGRNGGRPSFGQRVDSVRQINGHLLDRDPLVRCGENGGEFFRGRRVACGGIHLPATPGEFACKP